MTFEVLHAKGDSDSLWFAALFSVVGGYRWLPALWKDIASRL
jgi:hypothetical protein